MDLNGQLSFNTKKYIWIKSILYFILMIASMYFTMNLIIDYSDTLLRDAIRENLVISVIYYCFKQMILPFIMIVSSVLVFKLLYKPHDYVGLSLTTTRIFFFILYTIITLFLLGIMFVSLKYGGIISNVFSSWDIEKWNLIARVITVATGTMSVAIYEEVFGRGVFLKALSDRWNMKTAIVVTSILFGLMHIPKAYGTESMYLAPLNLSIGGAILALLFLKYETLWVPIGVHFGWNFGLYSLYNLTGTHNYKTFIYATEFSEPGLLFGYDHPSFGIESGLFVTVVFTWILILLLRSIDLDNCSI